MAVCSHRRTFVSWQRVDGPLDAVVVVVVVVVVGLVVVDCFALLVEIVFVLSQLLLIRVPTQRRVQKSNAVYNLCITLKIIIFYYLNL